MAGMEKRIDALIDECEVIETDTNEISSLIEHLVTELRKMKQQARHWKFFESLDAPHLASLVREVDFRLLVAVLNEAGPETRTRWRKALDEAQRQSKS